MIGKIIDGRVRQKAQTLEEWNNSTLDSLDGEQLFIRSDVDDAVIGFKFGAKNKTFSELPFIDLTVKDKANPGVVFSGRPSGIYVPTANGNYDGLDVNLAEGYQVIYWDGSIAQKVVYPIDYTTLVFGGVIDDSKDLSNPTEPIWYIAKAGEYNTIPTTSLGVDSILTWNGSEWSHIPFDLEVRGEFLIADNVQELRNIPEQVLQLLVNGTYKGVTLLGYYIKGDTPAPIEYYLSDTIDPDDGGSVFEVGSIKLISDKAISNPLYFGLGFSENEEDITRFFQAYSSFWGSVAYSGITINSGNFIITDTVEMPSNTSIIGSGGASIVAKDCVGLSFVDVEWVKIQGVKIGVESDSETDYTIFLQNCNYVNINGNEFYKGITAIRALNCHYIYITENTIHDMDFWGIYILGGSNIYTNNNTCYNNGRDGIKVAGNLSSGGELTIKNLNINGNSCYNNGRDGIDVAVNHLDGFNCYGNICRNNSLEGLDFKILAYTGGSVKNAYIQNNNFIDNLARGINVQNDIPNILGAYFQCTLRNNVITGGSVGSGNRYAVTIMAGGQTGTRVDFEYNKITMYEDGVRVNNTSNVNVKHNDINIRNKGIDLLNGLSSNVINNTNISTNNISFTASTGYAINFGGSGVLQGSITNQYCYDNVINGVGSVLKIIKNTSATFNKYCNNVIGEYSGFEIKPSFPANKNDVVLCIDPSGKLVNSWLCYEDSQLDERKYYAQNVVDKYFFINKKGTSVNFPTLGIDDAGFEFWHTTNNRPQWWSGTSWYDPLRDATTTTKGLVNQAVSLPTTATNEQIITALKNAGLMANL